MLTLHRSERTDVLAEALAGVLARPLGDPMATEIVSVPAAGVERWLQQFLAARLGCGAAGADGIAANIAFTGPARLADEITRAVSDSVPLGSATATASDDPWRVAALTWPVLRVLDRRIDDPELAIIARHIGGGDEQSPRIGRRYATARHLAELFDRYARARPAMIAAWSAGDDGDLRDDLTWQPGFWRAVRAEIGQPHPVEQLDTVCARLRDGAVSVLPERLSVFGPTRLTESFRRLLTAAAVHHDVHLFLPHPSPRLWSELAEAVSHADLAPDAGCRRTDRPTVTITNPLLAGLSHDVQELQTRILPLVDSDQHHPVPASGPPTVLSAVQAGIRDDTVESGVAEPDTSVEIHACHGPERQVEVLRDRLLHLFAADETLQPRDVLIMCPDVESFAPLIRGAFGQPGLGHPAFELRVRLADRGIRQINPILDVVVAVTELAAGRATAGEVCDLLDRAPVRERFAITDADLDLIREWLAHSNIRWGVAQSQRARFGLGGFRQGTFAAGLDRIALGAVAEEQDDEWLGTALPLDGVESTNIDLVGRFGEYIDRLAELLTVLDAGPASRTGWAQTLTEVITTLTATAPGDEWQRAHAMRLIDEAFADTTASEENTSLRLSDVRDLLSAMVSARPTRANFRTGELTVCTMVPMRSVPHRVIVLLGIDSEVFPRVQRLDGDDVLAVDPMVGERNPRDEDRQNFLDAICAAQENLLVFYSGADPVSGRRIPPAVVVSELDDAVRAVTRNGAGAVRRHTLHGFDERNFVPAAIAGIPGPFSHDESLFAGAVALRADPEPRARAADVILPVIESDDPADIDLDALIEFHVAPVAGFVRQRLGARIPAEVHRHADQLDVALDPLDKWGIGERFLTRMLAGATVLECQAAELRRGTLPPFAFGTRELESISRIAADLHRAAAPVRTEVPTTIDVLVELADGRRVHGTISDVHGDAHVAISFSRLRAKAQLSEWIRFLAIRAAAAQGNVAAAGIGRAVTIGRSASRGGVSRVEFAAPSDPVALLERLVRIRDAGLRAVLPIPIEPAHAYVEATPPGGHPDRGLRAARRAFEDRFGPHSDPYVRMVFGGDVDATVDFDELAGADLPADVCADLFDADLSDAGARLGPGEVFGALAQEIWAPLRDHIGDPEGHR